MPAADGKYVLSFQRQERPESNENHQPGAKFIGYREAYPDNGSAQRKERRTYSNRCSVMCRSTAVPTVNARCARCE